MNSRSRSFACLLSFALLAGCGDSDHETVESDDKQLARGIELFQKNKGVRLPAEMRRDLGVTTVEITERPFTPNLEKMAQVYRTADGAEPAAAVVWLSHDESADLRAGHNVQMFDPVSPATVVKGTLVRIKNHSFAGSGEIEVVIEFDDATKRFSTGSSLNAVFAGGHSRTALTVPETAVIHAAGGAFVYAVNGGHFTRTPVKVGAKTAGWAEITDGLYAGDVVVATAADSLWLIELCALKGGTPCCPVGTKPTGK